MAAPFDPTVTVEAGFGYAPWDEDMTWTSLTAYADADVSISRGRPSEFDTFRPASATIGLTDTTSRNLDPLNLSGAYVETVDTSVYPVIGAAVSEVGTSLGTNNAQTLPGGVTAGDLLIAVVSVDANGTTATTTGSGSATWTTLWDGRGTGRVVRCTVRPRSAMGSDALVVTGATQDYVCTIRRIVNHGCSTTADVKVGTEATATSLDPDPPSLNAASSKRWLWLAVATLDLNIGDNIDRQPSGWTSDTLTRSAASSSSVAQGVAWLWEEAQTVDPGTFLSSGGGGRWLANTFAVPPVAATAPRSMLGPNVPVRVVATQAARATVLSDPCTGPGLHSAWRLASGTLAPLSGTLVFGSGALIYGPTWNFDTDSSFQYHTVNDGASPNVFVYVTLSREGTMGFYLNGSTLTWYVTDGVGGYVSNTATWNDTTHAYLRFVVAGNVVTFQRSANGSSWTTLNAYTRGSDFDAATSWSAASPVLYSIGADVTLDDFLVQVSAHTRFVGTVDSWEWAPYPGNRGGEATIVATDGLKLLANTTLPSVYDSVVDGLSPAGWWKLQERSGDLAHDSSGYSRHAYYPTQGAQQGRDGMPDGIGERGVRFGPASTATGVALPDTARRNAPPFATNVWVKADAAFPNSALAQAGNLRGMAIFAQGDNGDGATFYLAIGYETTDTTEATNPIITAWTVQAIYDDGVTSTISHWEATIEDTVPHMVTFSQPLSTSGTLYIDGVAATLASAYVGYSAALLGQTIGKSGAPAGSTSGVSFPGVVAQAAFFDTVLTASDAVDLYAAGVRPWDGDTPGERVNRVLDLVGWPTNLRAVDAGAAVLGPAVTEGSSALDYLQTVAATEGGRLFVGRSGELVFHDAARVAARSSDVPIYADTVSRPAEPNAEVGILGDGFRLSADDRRLYTSATISRDGGAAQTYQDDTAVARYGVRSFTQSGLLMGSDVAAAARAAAVVGRYSTPQARLARFTVAPQKKPAVWGTVLAANLGDSIEVTFTPLASGSAVDDVFIIEGVDERIDSGAWTFQLDASPEDPLYGLFFEFNATADVGFDFGYWS